jgi:hypothetical protein
MGIVKAESLDMSKVTFSDVKVDQHGRKMVYINMKDNTGRNGKILVQTPKMYAPNGLKRWRKKDAIDNKDDKFELELSFSGEDGQDKNAQSIKGFHNKWKEFDECIKQAAVDKSKEWFGKSKMTLELVEDKYIPMVRVAMKDDEILPYPSRVRCKLDREMDSDGNCTGRFLSNKREKTPVLLFDENKKPIELNENNAETVVPKGCQVVCILELVYLSIGMNVSVKWKLVQAKVYKKQDAITEYAMLDDEELEEETDVAAEPASENRVAEDLDSENEDEAEGEVAAEHDSLDGMNKDDGEEEEEPVVEKVVTKKRGGKKTVSANA